MRKLTPAIGLAALFLATPAFAYMGPGPTSGAIAVVFGVLASIFFAIVGVLWYPIKRLLKIKPRKRTAGKAAQSAATQSAAAEPRPDPE